MFMKSIQRIDRQELKQQQATATATNILTWMPEDAAGPLLEDGVEVQGELVHGPYPSTLEPLLL